MRYLLLSVLVFCMVGIMIPNVSGTHVTNEEEKEMIQLISDMDEIVGKIPKTDVGIINHMMENTVVSKLSIHEGKNSDMVVVRLAQFNPDTKAIEVTRNDAELMDEQNRIFSPVFSFSSSFFTKSIEFVAKGNTNLDFDAICPNVGLSKIQPSLTYEYNMCYKIPKDSDHFILIDEHVQALLEREEIGLDAWLLYYNACNNNTNWEFSYFEGIETEYPFGCLDREVIATFDRDDVGMYNAFAQEQEITVESVSEPIQKASRECSGDYTFVDGMCTQKIDVEKKLGDKVYFNFDEWSKDIPNMSVHIKLIDPSGQIVQDKTTSGHNRLSIEYPEAGMVGDYETITEIYSGDNLSSASRIIVSVVGEEQQTQQFNGRELVYVLVAAIAVGGGVGAIFFIKKGTKSKPVQLESVTRKRVRKPAEKTETSTFCSNCGNTLKPEAKFCGKCGTSVP